MKIRKATSNNWKVALFLAVIAMWLPGVVCAWPVAGKDVVVEVDGSASTILTAAQISGTTVYNTGQTAMDVTYQLEAITKDTQFKVMIGTAQASNKWRFKMPTNNKAYLDGVAGLNGGYIKVQGPAVGNWLACHALKTGPASYDLVCGTGEGTWTAE